MNGISQYGKDLLLIEQIFKNKRDGFFVDIGAFDGKDLSCTYLLEKEFNWKGICLEPLYRNFIKLLNNRPNSVCLNRCAYSYDGMVTFRDNKGYTEMLSGVEEAYDPRHIQRIASELSGGSSDLIKVPCIRLDSLFGMYNVKHIDYLKIDTEGSESQVLRTIDFRDVDIDVIDLEENYESDYDKILQPYGYKRLFKHHIDVIYTK